MDLQTYPHCKCPQQALSQSHTQTQPLATELCGRGSPYLACTSATDWLRMYHHCIYSVYLKARFTQAHMQMVWHHAVGRPCAQVSVLSDSCLCIHMLMCVYTQHVHMLYVYLQCQGCSLGWSGHWGVSAGSPADPLGPLHCCWLLPAACMPSLTTLVFQRRQAYAVGVF